MTKAEKLGETHPGVCGPVHVALDLLGVGDQVVHSLVKHRVGIGRRENRLNSEIVEN